MREATEDRRGRVGLPGALRKGERGQEEEVGEEQDAKGDLRERHGGREGQYGGGAQRVELLDGEEVVVVVRARGGRGGLWVKR